MRLKSYRTSILFIPVNSGQVAIVGVQILIKQILTFPHLSYYSSFSLFLFILLKHHTDGDGGGSSNHQDSNIHIF